MTKLNEPKEMYIVRKITANTEYKEIDKKDIMHSRIKYNGVYQDMQAVEGQRDVITDNPLKLYGHVNCGINPDLLIDGLENANFIAYEYIQKVQIIVERGKDNLLYNKDED